MSEKFEYRDMFGREIKVGDYIVYAALADRSGVLRAGRVLELTTTKPKPYLTQQELEPKIKCESWNFYRSEGYSGKPDAKKSGRQKAVSLGFTNRMVVVPEEIVSQQIKDDLAGPIDYCA